MDIIGAIKNLFGFGQAVAEEVKQHEALVNTPEMRQAAETQDAQKRIEQIEKDVANEDLTAVQKDVAAPDAGSQQR